MASNMFGSGNNISRANATSPLDMPPLTECLHLEPITLGSVKCTRFGELRRVLGFGSASEDHSFGVGHPKPPPVSIEELKLFKESVLDASRKARDRSKMLKESIIKLDKYKEVLTSKKRQRSEFSVTDRSNGSNLVKMGSLIHRSPHEGMPQRLEDRAKSVGLNKRVRTSVADVRPDGKRSPSPRQQLTMEKAGDTLPDGGGGGVRFEEKIRRLPAGGEGWDTKNKKKRSVGMVSGRMINGDRDLKRSMLPKMSSDSKLRSCDAQDFRSKSSPGISGINKSDGSLEPSSSDTSTALRSEMESGPPPRDRMALLEKKVLTKASNKTNAHEENLASSPSALIKTKVSRAPRTGSIMQLDSSLKAHPSSTPLQGSEQASSSNKVPVPGMANNPKRGMSAGPSSHAMAQWVGQRPHKSSRTRRANIITPVSSNGEAQISSPSFVPSDFSGRMSSIAANGSLIPSSLDSSTPKIKREVENVPSPFGFSESEESGAGENKVKDKGRDSCETTPTASLKPGSFVIPFKKNKLPTNEVGEGVRRQGRTGRSPSLTRPVVNSGMEKLENQPPMKPIPIVKPPDKSKSKSGRPPSKKLKERKAVARVGPVLNGNSSDYTGESDDDREELFAAANSARNASSLACSGPFWKKMEPIFASVVSEDTSYLKEQLSFAEELDESLSQMLNVEYNVLGVLMHKESSNCSGEKLANGPNKKSGNSTSLCGKVDMERLEKRAPLYQRVLSALIEEDECEELYVHGEGKNVPPQCASDDSHCGSCNLIDIEHRDRDMTESEVESANFQNQRSYLLDGFSCNKSAASNCIRNSSMRSPLHCNGQWRGDDEVSHSDLIHGSEIFSSDMGLLRTRELTMPVFSSSDRQYQLLSLDDKILLELQSIGICLDKLPDLAEGEEVITQDIVELKEGLYEQIGEKRRKLEKIDRASLKDKDVGKRSVEKNAMDQLVEIAYRKRLACRGNTSSKGAVRKVPRQVALGFIKRTLGRCKKFEDGGVSCFSKPALQDALFSTPSCNNDAKSADCIGSGTASNTPNDVSNHPTEARLSGGVASSPLERNASLCDSFERGGSRRAKAKPPTKQKSAAANGPRASSHPTGAPNGRSKPEREVRPKEAEEEAMDLPLDELDKLGVSTDDGNQDLGSIFSLLDDDGLQDDYSVGLEIPMDDLSELNLM